MLDVPESQSGIQIPTIIVEMTMWIWVMEAKIGHYFRRSNFPIL